MKCLDDIFQGFRYCGGFTQVVSEIISTSLLHRPNFHETRPPDGLPHEAIQQACLSWLTLFKSSSLLNFSLMCAHAFNIYLSISPYISSLVRSSIHATLPTPTYTKEEERIAEEALVKRDPQRPMRSWTRGVSPRRDTAATTTPLGTESAGSLGRSRRDQPRLTTNGFDESSEREGDNADVTSGAQEIVNEGLVQEEGGNREAGVRVVADAGTSGGVPNFRLNGFVYICPLMTEGCKFTAKAWLQDEDD